MPKHLDINSWKGKPTDVAYKDPFSDATSRTRKKVILFSSIILLNQFFPIDLGKSHIIGLNFLEGHAPSLAGLLGLILVYFVGILAIYSFQEIKSWLAQANELAFVDYRRSLHDIFAHHQSIHTQIENTSNQLATHTTSVNELTEELKGPSDKSTFDQHMNSMNVHKESFNNICSNLHNSNVKFGEEIDKAIEKFKKTESDYRKAMSTQWVKVALLETALPFALSFLSIYLAYDGILQVLKLIFKQSI